jgi:hypothetical protein
MDGGKAAHPTRVRYLPSYIISVKQDDVFSSVADPGSGMGESQHQDKGSGMNNPDHIL